MKTPAKYMRRKSRPEPKNKRLQASGMAAETCVIQWASHQLAFGRRTCVMGILNVTPDSFSDGGRYFSVDAAVAKGIQLVRDGADILDVGGESTRPFSDSVSQEEELQRVAPVIKRLSKAVSIPISIDTTKAEVARQAVEAGASMINDISALQGDPGMADVVSDCRVPVVLMHMQGTPRTMQAAPRYKNPVLDIKRFLSQSVQFAESRNIPRSRIIIDPGIGFGKTAEQNLLLIRRLRVFKSMGLPILVGTSRKSFIRHSLGFADDVSPSSGPIETATQATVAAAVLNGAHIVRVHDVATTRITVRMVDALKHGCSVVEPCIRKGSDFHG
jgi:dihydropteroate synthase